MFNGIYSGDYFYNSLLIFFGNTKKKKQILIQYLRSKYNDGGYTELKEGIFIHNYDANNKKSNSVKLCDNIFNNWYEEKIIFYPVKKKIQYFVDNELYGEVNVNFNLKENDKLKIKFSPYGWYTGHKQLFDNFSVSNDEIEIVKNKKQLKGEKRGESKEELERKMKLVDLYSYSIPMTGRKLYTPHKINELNKGDDGWAYKGVLCKVFLFPNEKNIPIYKYFNDSTGNVFFTNDKKEAKQYWQFKGVSFYVFKEKNKNLVPLYRYLNVNTGYYFYTIHYKLFGKGNELWDYQGIIGYVKGDINISNSKLKKILDEESNDVVASLAYHDDYKSISTVGNMYLFKDGIKIWVYRKRFEKEWYINIDNKLRYYKNENEAIFGFYMRKKNGKFHKKDKGYYKQPASNGNLLSYNDYEIISGKQNISNIQKFSTQTNYASISVIDGGIISSNVCSKKGTYKVEYIDGSGNSKSYDSPSYDSGYIGYLPGYVNINYKSSCSGKTKYVKIKINSPGSYDINLK